ncbi:IS5 family transposase [Nostoc sp.]|uniref:IS5 family transposase n=1 Tax=Nostoc sp. TaxID=1180 RepID=UPI003FA5609C
MKALLHGYSTEESDPPNPIGRKRIDARAALDAIIFRLRSGCQWNQLPSEFPDDSSVHRTFQRWEQNGVLDQIWATLVEECDELGGVDWQWQSADAAMAKARFGGDEIGPNPTDRAKPGTKRSVLVEADGGPLAVVIGAANVHDCKLLESTLKAIIVERPSLQKIEQHLCLDKGYDNPTGRNAIEKHQYIPHIRRIGEEKLDEQHQKRYPARRWVVERTLGWLSKCRALLVRYDKKACNYLGIIKIACTLLWYRRCWRLSNAG